MGSGGVVRHDAARAPAPALRNRTASMHTEPPAVSDGSLAAGARVGAGALVSFSGMAAGAVLLALRDPGGTVLLSTLGADANGTRAILAAVMAFACALAGAALWVPPLRSGVGSAGAKLAGAAAGLVLAVPAAFVAAALAYALAGLAT